MQGYDHIPQALIVIHTEIPQVQPAAQPQDCNGPNGPIECKAIIVGAMLMCLLDPLFWVKASLV